MVSVLDCQSRGSGVQIPARVEIGFEIPALPVHLANSAVVSTLTVHCLWGDETVRKRTGHPPSYAEAKKMKLLTLHAHGCPMTSLRDCSSFSSSSSISSSCTVIGISHKIFELIRFSYLTKETKNETTFQTSSGRSLPTELLQSRTKIAD